MTPDEEMWLRHKLASQLDFERHGHADGDPYEDGWNDALEMAVELVSLGTWSRSENP